MKKVNQLIIAILLICIVSCSSSNFSFTDKRKWYIYENSQEMGPFTRSQLKDYKITSSTLVRLDGSQGWVGASNYPEIINSKKQNLTTNPINTAESSPKKESDSNKPVQNYMIINYSNPGQKIDINNYIEKGYITIFDFYSEYCPPCRAIAPKLQSLANRRPDIVVRKIDINRAGVRGIDWQSPVARQYNLHSIPHFRIYWPETNTWTIGSPAYSQIMKFINS